MARSGLAFRRDDAGLRTYPTKPIQCLGSEIGTADGLPSRLEDRQFLRSATGAYCLFMHADGRTTLIRTEDSAFVWVAPIGNGVAGSALEVMPDGMLVLRAPGQAGPTWSFGPPAGAVAPFRLLVTDDGVLELRDGNLSLAWSTAPGFKPAEAAPEPVAVADRPDDLHSWIMGRKRQGAALMGRLRMIDDEAGLLDVNGYSDLAQVLVYRPARSGAGDVLTLYFGSTGALRIEAEIASEDVREITLVI